MITTTWAILWIPPAGGDEVTEPDDDGGAAGAASAARRGVDDEVHATAAKAMAAPAARTVRCLGMTQSCTASVRGPCAPVAEVVRARGGQVGARGPIVPARPVPGGNGTGRTGRRGDAQRMPSRSILKGTLVGFT